MTKNSMLPAVIAAALTIFAVSANAQTTFTVYKAVMTLSGFNADVSHTLLTKDSLSNTEIINIALNQPLTTKNPKNIILAGAVDFTAAYTFGGSTTAPAQLIVFNTDTQTKIVQVAEFDGREEAENRILTKFFRLTFGRMALMDTGGVTFRFVSGDIRSSSLVKRTLVAGLTPESMVKISAKSTLAGVANIIVDGTAQEFFVNKGKIALTGTPVGSFSE